MERTLPMKERKGEREREVDRTSFLFADRPNAHAKPLDWAQTEGYVAVRRMPSTMGQ